jgi:urea transport system substrate-binding protein
MEAAYLGVHFWAQAVEQVGTLELNAVRSAIRVQKYDAPEGRDVRVDADNQHTWKYFRLAQITPEGTFRIEVAHDSPTKPDPYPKYRTPQEWAKFQNDLFEMWGKRWSRQPG